MIVCRVIKDLKCPGCNGNLQITAVACTGCQLQITGAFKQNWVAGLDDDQLDFLLTFVRCRGVLRDMESVLGISYPTVRNRVDLLVHTVEELIEITGAAATRRDPRAAVLSSLAAGEISLDRAMNLLDALTHS